LELYIDGYDCACKPKPTDTLDDVLAEVRANNLKSRRAILGLTCDGIDVIGNTLTDYLATPASSFERIDIQTGIPDTLIVHAMREARDTLSRAERERGEVVELLGKGKSGDAVILLGRCLNHWYRINEAISKSLGLIDTIPDAFEIDLRELVAALEPIADKLADVKSAVKSQNYVSLADILEYEFDEVTTCWRGVIEKLLDQLAGSDASAP
jgi:hypothetical protein